MAGIDLGTTRKRSLDHSLPLLPFIDFMLCMVAFLLVTAVWSRMARLDLDSRVPGDDRSPPSTDSPPALHVEVRSGDRFSLAWKQGNTVLSTQTVSASPVHVAGGLQYPDLEKAVERSWRAVGASTDGRQRVAILHTDNSAPFEEIAAVVDAVYATNRGPASDSGRPPARAFNVALATD